uniref:Uncharacterized protein n=1 Tax=Lepeophtheirus salmonis TaxID=72036 RepID=A0A0K2TIP6_LEPSM
MVLYFIGYHKLEYCEISKKIEINYKNVLKTVIEKTERSFIE